MEVHTHPSFVFCLFPRDLEKTSMRLPSSFVRQCGDHVPEQVTLNICNGYHYYVRFNKDKNKLKKLALFFNDFQNESGFHALFCYNGAGIFTVFILDHSGMEIEYPAARNLLLAPVYLQDNVNGIQKKFIVHTDEKHTISAEIEIPSAFLDRFRHMLKQKNYVTLKNGEKFMFTFSACKKMFVGLREILRSKYWKAGYTLLFELSGRNEFLLTIFSKEGVEKTLPSPSSDAGNVIAAEDIIDMRTTFESVLLRSNLDMNFHGVYIPSWIALENHSWKSVRHAYLKSNGRKWKVGVVCSGGRPRFSKGWDKFVKENKFVLGDRLRFVMKEENNVLSFAVRLL